MAFSIGRISSPRTSPTMTRSAFIRSDRRTRSATGIRPAPSMLAGRASSATMSGCRDEPVSSPSSNACSMVTMRSRSSISAARARSKVVFPEFMAPETTMFFRARTAAPRKDRNPWSMAPMAHSSSSDRSAKRCRRMETAGRAATAMRADRRAPPGSWRSSSGRAASNRRSASPKRPPAERRRSTSSSSESATGSMSRLDPSANVAQTWSHPLMSMFSISSSSTNDWRRPRPNSASRTDCARPCSS